MSTLDQISPSLIEFDSVTFADLERMESAERDALSFGVIGLTAANEVDIYNATESRMAGLRPSRVIGESFFISVAVCMNNYLVAQRFEDEALLDEVIDYVLTFRMRPTKVKLRMLKTPGAERRYILIKR